MTEMNTESFVSSNNLNVSSSLCEREQSPRDFEFSSTKPNTKERNNLNSDQPSDYYSSGKNNLKFNSSQKDNINYSPSHLSTLTTTIPSQPKSSMVSKSSINNQVASISSFKNKIVAQISKDDVDENKYASSGEGGSKEGLSDLDCSLSLDKHTEDGDQNQDFPAENEIDSLKNTFDDLIRRKSNRELMLKQQIENNKKSLLEKFFNYNNNNTNSNNSIEHFKKSDYLLEKKKIKENIYDNEEDDICMQVTPNKNVIHNNVNPISQIDEESYEKEKENKDDASSNTNNEPFNYQLIREKYKSDRARKKTKSSIFKSEDLRISKADNLNLRNSEKNEDAMNIYSPIGVDNNLNINKKNVIYIQKKLFESDNSENYNNNDYILKGSIEDVNYLDINDISIKEEKNLVVEKVNNFSFTSKRKTPQKPERNNRMLSMQLVEKIDYNLTPHDSNQCSSKKHNKTTSNVINVGAGNTKNLIKNVLILNSTKNQKKVEPKYKQNIQTHRIEFSENMFNKLNKRTHSNSKNNIGINDRNLFLNTKNFPFTTKNRPVTLKLVRSVSKNKKDKSNLNQTITSLSSNKKIKYTKMAYQLEASTKLKNMLELAFEPEKIFLIYCEKAKENFVFKGIYETNLNKKIANKLCSPCSSPSVLTLFHYDCYLEDENKNFFKTQNIPNPCNKTVLVVKKTKII